MLTRENFKDTWARPKEDGKNAPVENMVVDGATNEDSTEIKMEGIVEGKGTKSDNARTWTPLKMPIFRFQHRGIGAIKGGKRQYQKQ